MAITEVAYGYGVSCQRSQTRQLDKKVCIGSLQITLASQGRRRRAADLCP